MNAVAVGTCGSLVLPEMGSGRHALRADYFEGQINPKQFRSRYPHHRVLATDPLVIEPQAGSWAVLMKFGAVVFWNCPAGLTEDILKEVKELPGAQAPNPAIADNLEVVVDAESEERVTFDEIRLRELTIDKLKIVSLAMGQSVALERFENEVAEALKRTDPIADALREKGELRLSERSILKTIGFVMKVRSAVLANLTLFDDPPETWQSETLSRLDSALYDHFDLEERLSAINQKIQFLSDVNEILMDLIQNHKAHRLEWIIIILIVIEIVFFVFVEMK